MRERRAGVMTFAVGIGSFGIVMCGSANAATALQSSWEITYGRMMLAMKTMERVLVNWYGYRT